MPFTGGEARVASNARRTTAFVIRVTSRRSYFMQAQAPALYCRDENRDLNPCVGYGRTELHCNSISSLSNSIRPTKSTEISELYGWYSSFEKNLVSSRNGTKGKERKGDEETGFLSFLEENLASLEIFFARARALRSKRENRIYCFL